MTLREYPCPECGHEGPHPEVEAGTFECIGCYSEFRIPLEEPSDD